MSSKLYDLMDWRNIEGILFADLDDPFVVLGVNNRKNEKLIQIFRPDAIKVEIIFDASGKVYKTEEVDDSYFAVLVPKKETGHYKVKAYYDNENTFIYYDPYQFKDLLPRQELKKFNLGTNYKVYELLGAHCCTVEGIKGVRFAVWAPFAKRVSVVGDFNFWDGRRHMMRRVEETGVFELFIPELPEGELYKYEIKMSNGENILKADPYAFGAQKRPDNASVVRDIEKYKWTDEKWMKDRKTVNFENSPMSIYEVHLGSWRKPQLEDTEAKESFYTYRELAPLLAQYVKEMNYTHIELMPVMEHPLDASWGYQVTGYYAPTARYGTPEDFMYFMDYMHKENIGIIIDWVPAHFPRDAFGLARFDGTCLYEHLDPRQGSHPHWGTLIYNYGRPEVRDFLISNAVFWAEKYHVDGIRMDAVASMLYLDYGKQDGEWVANMYGGNENLEAMDFLRELNTQMKKYDNSVLMIAEESTAWPKVTGDVKDDGLGFDLKWNMGWMNDFTSYMKCDTLFRKNSYSQLTFSMIYNYSEKFVLVLSHDEVVHGKCSMISKMPGDEPVRFANLRAAYAFMAAHPGKKLLFMGQEFAGYREWSEERELDWASINDEKHFRMQQLVKDLNKLYITEKALHELDYDTDGFQWIDNLSWEENLCSFVRKGKKPQDILLIVCNFDMINHAEYKVGVPKAGKYKEIFNTDDEKYGGNGNVNVRVKTSKKEEVHGREDSITISLAPLTVAIFKYSAVKSTVAEELEKQYIKAEIGEKAVKEEKPVNEEKAVEKEKPVKEEKVIEEEKPAKEEKAVEEEKLAKEEKAVEEDKPIKEEKAVKEEKSVKEEKAVKEEIAPQENKAVKEENLPKEVITPKEENAVKEEKNLKENKPQAPQAMKNKGKKPSAGKSKASKKKRK